jgi:hypothetical protein
MNNQKYICVYDLIFYIADENGNDIQDKNKKTKLYRLKDNIRFKPLEYITEDLDLNMIEEVRKEI